MAKEKDRTKGNPLKQGNTNKDTTRKAADQTDPQPPRTPTQQTETGKGGAHKGGGKPDTSHPSQHGGAKQNLDKERPRE